MFLSTGIYAKFNCILHWKTLQYSRICYLNMDCISFGGEGKRISACCLGNENESPISSPPHTHTHDSHSLIYSFATLSQGVWKAVSALFPSHYILWKEGCLTNFIIFQQPYNGSVLRYFLFNISFIIFILHMGRRAVWLKWRLKWDFIWGICLRGCLPTIAW